MPVKAVGEQRQQPQEEEDEDEEEEAMRPNKAEIDVALAAAPRRVTQRQAISEHTVTPTSQLRLKQSCKCTH